MTNLEELWFGELDDYICSYWHDGPGLLFNFHTLTSKNSCCEMFPYLGSNQITSIPTEISLLTNLKRIAIGEWNFQ